MVGLAKKEEGGAEKHTINDPAAGLNRHVRRGLASFALGRGLRRSRDAPVSLVESFTRCLYSARPQRSV